MLPYTIKRITDTVDWMTVPTIPMQERYEGTPEDATAEAKICYDDTALHLLLSTRERVIRRVEVGPTGWPCHDSCLEFFFCPMEGDSRYFNIEFNANKCLFLGFGTGIPDLVRLIVDPDEIFAPEVRIREDGWEIEYTIPHAFVRRFFPAYAPTAGTTIRANCYKCADEKTPPEFLSWSRVDEENFTFHRPTHYGTMTFA